MYEYQKIDIALSITRCIASAHKYKFEAILTHHTIIDFSRIHKGWQGQILIFQCSTMSYQRYFCMFQLSAKFPILSSKSTFFTAENLSRVCDVTINYGFFELGASRRSFFIETPFVVRCSIEAKSLIDFSVVKLGLKSDNYHKSRAPRIFVLYLNSASMWK